MKRENPPEVTNKYPNLTAPQRPTIIRFKHPEDLKSAGTSRIRDIVERELSDVDEIIAENVELGAEEEVTVVYNEPGGGKVQELTVDIPEKHVEGDTDPG